MNCDLDGGDDDDDDDGDDDDDDDTNECYTYIRTCPVMTDALQRQPD